MCLLLPLSYAESTVTGTVSLTVINREPVIEKVRLEPATPYVDEIPLCIPEVNDEDPDKVNISVSWEVNGVLVDNLTDIKENDTVRCTVYAIDIHGLNASPKSVQTSVRVASTSSKITSFLSGGKTPLRVIEEKPNLLTGMVIGNTGQGLTTLPIAIAVLLAIINIILVVKIHGTRLVRKT